jgi:hypothetical protein
MGVAQRLEQARGQAVADGRAEQRGRGRRGCAAHRIGLVGVERLAVQLAVLAGLAGEPETVDMLEVQLKFPALLVAQIHYIGPWLDLTAHRPGLRFVRLWMSRLSYR